jgi:PIN domain nuclease of toxin-antitoxin system
LDASAILAVLQNERGAESIYHLLPTSVVSAVSVAEVFAKLLAKGMPRTVICPAVRALHVEVAPFGWAEAEASMQFVGPDMSLGDRACLGTAAVLDAPVVTGDHDWKKIVTGVKVEVFREWRKESS